MKKVLENPFLVGVLAIAAFIVVYRTAFKKPTYAAPVAEQQSPEDTSEISDLPTPNLRIDVSRAQWTMMHERNPFSSKPSEAKDETEDAIDEATPEVAPVLNVSAIWLEGMLRLTVINDQVLSEGERILDYSVEKILADQIVVKGRGGNIVINFPEIKDPLVPKNRIVNTIEER